MKNKKIDVKNKKNRYVVKKINNIEYGRVKEINNG